MIDTIVIAILLLKDIKLRLTVVSRKAKKKQHAHTSSGLHEHYSKLFTWMAALKFENAVTQPLQWNPSKTDTIGEIKFVLYKEVFFIQGFLNYDIFLICHIIASREINNILHAVRILTVN